jgi:nitroimidazol reductase NimA-like FMN-containing flavoprotein (pyridoxamine 5'-phosphate oxidase superfamily)
MSRTAMTRLPEKGSASRAALDALLDASKVGHFALSTDDGPVVIPTAIARDGDRVLAHGSTGSRWMRMLADGAPTCLAVTAFEGLVVARSAFESSMHYRSAVLFGRCSAVRGAAAAPALDVITEHLIPGRVAELRRPTAKELAATLVLELPIEQWSLKISDKWPEDLAEDVAGDAWAGVLPLVSGHGVPRPAPDLRAGIPVPKSVRRIVDGGVPGSSAR